MNLIIETDIGHDPDDFFALCYLHSIGANIRSIVVSPGYKGQLAIVRAFCKEVGLDIPIGYAGSEGGTNYKNDFHTEVVKSMGYRTKDTGDGLGKDIIYETLKNFPDCEGFICGPLLNFGKYFEENPDHHLKKITMQGGFLPYSQHNYDVEKLDKFIGKTLVPTFNLNGSKKYGKYLSEEANIDDLRFVGKNICHTIIYDQQRHEWIKEKKPKNKAQEIFLQTMDMYMQRHDAKKFHDPVAAVCHMHPEIGTWVQAKLYNQNELWGSYLSTDTNTSLIADIDRKRFWDCIREGR